MDPLTQGALGGAIAVAGFRHRLGPRSVAFAALAAMSPDIDVLVGLWGDEWTTLAAHRGSSHSMLVLPLVAPLVGWLGWRFFDPQRRGAEPGSAVGARGALHSRRYRSWSWLAFWALLTHPLLDVFTTYGTQLLAPLSRRRFAFDAVAIIDPIFTVPLLAVVALAWIGRWRPIALRRAGWLALGFCVLYLAWGLWVSADARRLARTELAEAGVKVERVRASPLFFFPPLRRVIALDDQGRFWSGTVSAVAGQPIRFAVQSSDRAPEIEAVLATRGGRTFSWFADGWVRAELAENGRTVRLYDERYGLITRPEFTPFVAVGELDSAGRPTSVEPAGRAFDGDDDPRQALAGELAAGWRLVRGRPIELDEPPEGPPEGPPAGPEPVNPSSDPES